MSRNLLDHPTFKLEDRKAILNRVYISLLDDDDAVLTFGGLSSKYTPEKVANWEARQTIAELLSTFPATEP